MTLLESLSALQKIADAPSRRPEQWIGFMQTVHTISFPDAELLAAVSPIPGNLKAVIWDLESEPAGGDLGEIDGVILPYLNAAAVVGGLSRAEGLKFVQTQSTGYDGVISSVGPSAAIATAAGVHAAATAELAVGLVLAKLRGIDQAARDQLTKRWRPERRKSLADCRVLLVGVGGIGQEIARRLEPFEVQITRVGSTERTDDHGRVYASSALPELAPSHDVLITVLPLNEHTYQLLGEELLAALPDDALVVNMGRGAVVDTVALTKQVLSGRLQCALDVVDPEPLPEDHPLWTTPNALITPHLGGNTSAFERRIVKLLKAQLEALARGKAPANLVQRGPF
jgi:phosphoglycerate dehydrogenase-like enzyme